MTLEAIFCVLGIEGPGLGLGLEGPVLGLECPGLEKSQLSTIVIHSI